MKHSVRRRAAAALADKVSTPAGVGTLSANTALPTIPADGRQPVIMPPTTVAVEIPVPEPEPYIDPTR